jgi:hypothetical protein
VLILCCTLQARPLNIIIVTSTDSSEDGYAEFLQDIYLDNVNVEIDDNRYSEISSLKDTEKQQLRDADLIIVSSKNDGKDYDDDSAFWSTLTVPILSHNIEICQSDNHDNWDWFSSGKTDPDIPLSEFLVTDPNDSLFNGIDVTTENISILDSIFPFEIPDETYTGNVILLATDVSGLPVIVRFDGTEPNYYDGSLYDLNGTPRIFFAMPDEPAIFFENATEPAKQLLRNAVTDLMPECWLIGDIDCDRDVDMHDWAELSAQWLESVPPESNSLSADIVLDGHVNVDDLALFSAFWLEGFDDTPPLPKQQMTCTVCSTFLNALKIRIYQAIGNIPGISP